MSTGLSAVFQTEFDAQVKAAYQKSRVLRPHVRVKSGGVVGSQVEFRRYTNFQAVPRIPQTDVVAAGQGYAKVMAVLAGWNASEYTDHIEQVQTSVDDRAAITANIGAAIGRREDQVIINALEAANAATIVHGSAGLTDAKMRRAQAIFDDKAVPAENRIIAISAQGKEQLLADPRFSSADYVHKRVVETGELPPKLYGFTPVLIETRAEGGLPKVGNVRTLFAWDKQAMGLALGLEEATEIAWIPHKRSWLMTQDWLGGAVGIDVAGILELEIQEV